MKNICLIAAFSTVSALKIKASIEGVRYPGEPYRPPYLEKVTKDLSANLNEQIPDSIPTEMNHLLCMFEEYSGTAEWERLGCDNFLTTLPAAPSKPDINCAETPELCIPEPPVAPITAQNGHFMRISWNAPDNHGFPLYAY